MAAFLEPSGGIRARRVSEASAILHHPEMDSSYANILHSSASFLLALFNHAIRLVQQQGQHDNFFLKKITVLGRLRKERRLITSSQHVCVSVLYRSPRLTGALRSVRMSQSSRSA